MQYSFSHHVRQSPPHLPFIGHDCWHLQRAIHKIEAEKRVGMGTLSAADKLIAGSKRLYTVSLRAFEQQFDER